MCVCFSPPGRQEKRKKNQRVFCLIFMYIYSQEQTKKKPFLDSVNVGALLSERVCEQVSAGTRVTQSTHRL